jgi:tetratricopeptide (TPR) repeat protein
MSDSKRRARQETGGDGGRGAISPPQGPDELVLDGSQETERVLERLAVEQPTYADLRHRLGLLHLSRGAAAAAQGEFEEALGIHPGYRAAYYGLRFARMMQGEELQAPSAAPEEAEGPREEALWAAVDDAYRRWQQGAAPLEAFSATPFAGQLAAEHYGAAFAALGGDAEATRTHLQAAARGSAVSREILTELGWLQAAPEALLAEVRSLLWTPLAVDLYAFQGRIYARNGLRAEALASYGRAFLAFPDAALFARHRAEVAIAFGEEEAAIDFLTQAIEADPTSVESRIALGYEYAAQGSAEEACLQFEVAAKLAPAYADVRYNLGLLYMAGDRPEEALRQLRRALSINPGYVPARRSLVSLLGRLGEHEAALREGQRILRQGFASADLLVGLGRAALSIDEVETAREYLERAIATEGEFAPAYYLLGRLYRRTGQKKKAQAAWRKYLALSDPGAPRIPGPILAAETPAGRTPAGTTH